MSGVSTAHDLNYYGIADQRASLLSGAQRTAMAAFYRPFSLPVLLLLAGGCLAAGTGAMRRALSGEHLAALAVVAAASVVPAMATYPLIHVLAAFYVLLTLVIYAGVGRIVSTVMVPR